MTKEELKKLKETIAYFGHWYDVIGEERVLILERSIEYIAELEKEKCELLGIIQGKDTAIQDLQKENAELKQINLDNGELIIENEKLRKEQLTKAKDFLNEFMRISKASDEDFEHDYSELIGEAEQFLRE